MKVAGRTDKKGYSKGSRGGEDKGWERRNQGWVQGEGGRSHRQHRQSGIVRSGSWGHLRDEASRDKGVSTRFSAFVSLTPDAVEPCA